MGAFRGCQRTMNIKSDTGRCRKLNIDKYKYIIYIYNLISYICTVFNTNITMYIYMLNNVDRNGKVRRK